MRTKLVRIAAIGVVLALLLGDAVYYGLQYTRPAVTTTHLAHGPVVQAFYATGTISPEREYPIRAQVTGVVKDLPVDKGTAVKKGDLLAVIDDPKLTFNVASAEAQLREANALADEKTSPAVAEFDAQLRANTDQLAIAQRDYDRYVKTLQANASTAMDVDRALDRIKQLTSEQGSLTARRATVLLAKRKEAEVAAAALATAKAELDKQNVRSPIDGVILDRPIPLGTRVDAVMDNHLMTLANVRQDALVMRSQVDEEDIAKVSVGQTVKMTLYAFGETVFEGKVRKIYDKADPERRTFEVDVEIDAKGRRLSAGMTGELAFIQQEKLDAAVLPAQAVQMRIRPRREGEARPAGDTSSAAAVAEASADEIREAIIWTVKDAKLAAVRVELGLRSVDRVEVVSGLSDGDEVVISAIDGRTKEGRHVRTTPAAPLKPERLAPATPTPSASRE